MFLWFLNRSHIECTLINCILIVSQYYDKCNKNDRKDRRDLILRMSVQVRLKKKKEFWSQISI